MYVCMYVCGVIISGVCVCDLTRRTGLHVCANTVELAPLHRWAMEKERGFSSQRLLMFSLRFYLWSPNIEAVSYLPISYEAATFEHK